MTQSFYYVPHHSKWPIIGSIGLFMIAIGIVQMLHDYPYALAILAPGCLLLSFMLYGWFRNVIHENQQGLYSLQVDRSFRISMLWFIFSEVMFFAAFFGALFYARFFAVPRLGGLGEKIATHELLWNNFEALWPLLKNPDPNKFPDIQAIIPAFGLPALNTLILLSSGLTITIAHHALKKQVRSLLLIGLFITILLGVSFLILQGIEYHHAYQHLSLKLSSGIYGTTFFMLTGFHGFHVFLGSVILSTILIRCLKGDFSLYRPFAFEAAAWYWHFVDVIWLLLFIFVYWL